ESVLKPLFLAFGLYFVLKPGADWLNNHGFNPLQANATMLLLLILALSLIGLFAWLQVDSFLSNEEKISELELAYSALLVRSESWPIVGDYVQNMDTSQSPTQILGDMGIEIGSASQLASLSGMVFSSLTVLFFLLFIIFEANLLPGRIEAAFPGDSLGRFQSITERARDGINTYIVVKTGVSIGTGTCAGLICLFFGIELWFVWAVGAIVLNYVPYIGSLIASVPPALLGMLMMNDDPFNLLLFLGLLVANQQFWGSLIETKWAGEALDLSPVLLLIVVAFSYWLWGVVGMVISVPFTVIIKIILDTVEQTRPLAVLMSERSPDLQKVWNDALRDGRLDDWEFTRLLELQRNLEIDEQEMNITAGKAAIITALERGSLSPIEREFVIRYAKNTTLGDKAVELLVPGALSPSSIELLENLLESNEEE
ncbi:MAG: AI-2E family transporter, partial [Candidatus Thermoplasmatota archaeon]|nr:AI-2E family transporter [Candidatus Thermoplasmatota archaeon]